MLGLDETNSRVFEHSWSGNQVRTQQPVRWVFQSSFTPPACIVYLQ